MDSEDDMLDANDVESIDDDFYSGDTGIESDDADANYDFDNDSDDSEDMMIHRPQQNYAILKEEDIREHQEEDIASVSAVLSISRVAACILLRHYNWSVSKVNDEWFADEARVRQAVGLLEKPVVEFPNAPEVICGICFESYSHKGIDSAACGHPFCRACWAAYMSTSIADGPGCLMLRCPDPSCGAAVGQDMINKLANDEDKGKYSRYLLRSYIENNRKVSDLVSDQVYFFWTLAIPSMSVHRLSFVVT
ncbi:Zinc finger, C3HC4 RING-type [Dillenia turbinata]|uniref:RBR-type E3 ubiquitin transferase n=1 Tax=Dillenia turbinata TaxID=194707 RepID=A0AAN8VJG1_9MAGN